MCDDTERWVRTSTHHQPLLFICCLCWPYSSNHKCRQTRRSNLSHLSVSTSSQKMEIRWKSHSECSLHNNVFTILYVIRWWLMSDERMDKASKYNTFSSCYYFDHHQAVRGKHQAPFMFLCWPYSSIRKCCTNNSFADLNAAINRWEVSSHHTFRKFQSYRKFQSSRTDIWIW